MGEPVFRSYDKVLEILEELIGCPSFVEKALVEAELMNNEGVSYASFLEYRRTLAAMATTLRGKPLANATKTVLAMWIYVFRPGDSAMNEDRILKAIPTVRQDPSGMADSWARFVGEADRRDECLMDMNHLIVPLHKGAAKGTENITLMNDDFLSSALCRNPVSPSTTAKETEMKIENITLINGVNAAHLSDDAIIAEIARAEGEIKKMEAIAARPAVLVKKLVDTKGYITKLVAILDARYPDAAPKVEAPKVEATVEAPVQPYSS